MASGHEQPSRGEGHTLRTLGAVVLLVALLALWQLSVGDESVKLPVVHLDCGPVQGIYDITNEVFIFQGIPYATPPIGELRWRRPVPIYPDACWTGMLKATTSNQCPQQIEGQLTGEEDCLKVNIRTPSEKIRNSLLPVVVNIHCGYLATGNSTYPGLAADAKLTRNMNAVFVDFNYRLGPFGFLVAKELDEDQSGNYGIWDQIELLKWVKSHIEKFGGDPNKITLTGVSSGATSAMLLAVSPRAQGLFHRVWGSSPIPRIDARLDAVIASSSSIYHRYVATSGCTDAACLRHLPMEAFFANTCYGDPVFPTRKTQVPGHILIDGDLLSGGYDDVWRNKPTEYSRVPLLIGTNAQEWDFAWTESMNSMTEADLTNILKDGLEEFGTNLTEQALEVYNLSLQDDPEYVISTLTGDIYITCGWNRNARAAGNALANPVYRYVVTHPPSSRFITQTGVYARYAFHSWDGYAVFCSLDKSLTPRQSDLDFQKQMRDLVTEFVHQGSISGWETFPKATMLIGGNVEVLYSEYHQKHCEFWRRNGLLDLELAD